MKLSSRLLFTAAALAAAAYVTGNVPAASQQNGAETSYSARETGPAEKITSEKFSKGCIVSADGKEFRLSETASYTGSGKQFAADSLRGRTVWIMRDGTDSDGTPCAVVWLSDPRKNPDPCSSFNRLLCAKGYAERTSVSSGKYAGSLADGLTYTH